jgi:hypothetical protein
MLRWWCAGHTLSQCINKVSKAYKKNLPGLETRPTCLEPLETSLPGWVRPWDAVVVRWQPVWWWRPSWLWSWFPCVALVVVSVVYLLIDVSKVRRKNKKNTFRVSSTSCHLLLPPSLLCVICVDIGIMVWVGACTALVSRWKRKKKHTRDSRRADVSRVPAAIVVATAVLVVCWFSGMGQPWVEGLGGGRNERNERNEEWEERGARDGK